MKVRKSNFELMRIISMIMIVIWHIIIHGSLLSHTTGAIHFCLNLILAICVVHVNSYVLVSGYFSHNKKFSFKKIVSLLNSALFYSVIIVIIFSLLKLVDLNNVSILKEISYLPFSEYWFIKDYVILCCFTPFLNILIKNMNQKQYKALLWILLIIFSILPTISGQEIFNVNKGHSLYNFIFMYLLGAYFNIYPIEKSKILQGFNKRKIQLTLVILFSSLVFFNVSLVFLSERLSTFDSNLFNEIGRYINIAFTSYNNPIVVIQSVCYLMLFSTLTIKSKIVNRISLYVLGVYLIHDNNIVREHLYEWLKFDTGNMIDSNFILVKVILFALGIFTVCIFIEFIRKSLFKFISNRKISKKITKKIDNFINSFNDEDNNKKNF